MSPETEVIKKRMKVLERLIQETRDRLPAHSIKPPVMMDLLAYEDEYQTLMDTLNELNRS